MNGHAYWLEMNNLSPTGNTRIIRFAECESRLAAAESRAVLLADEAYASELLNEIEARLTAKPNSILSLDVFDTLLLRNDKSEVRRFYEIAGRVAEQLSNNAASNLNKEDVLAARYTATLASYRLSKPMAGCREGSIDEIWGLAATTLGLEPEDAAKCIDAEISYEGENLTVNPVLLLAVERHVARGGKVALLSDMYLEARYIRRLVEGLGVGTEFAAVVSSANEKVSKRSGGVFSIIERLVGCGPESFFHIGDSHLGDYQNPRQRGWRAMHLPISVGERRRRVADDIETRRLLSEMHGLFLPRVERPS